MSNCWIHIYKVCISCIFVFLYTVCHNRKNLCERNVYMMGIFFYSSQMYEQYVRVKTNSKWAVQLSWNCRCSIFFTSSSTSSSYYQDSSMLFVVLSNVVSNARFQKLVLDLGSDSRQNSLATRSKRLAGADEKSLKCSEKKKKEGVALNKKRSLTSFSCPQPTLKTSSNCQCVTATKTCSLQAGCRCHYTQFTSLEQVTEAVMLLSADICTHTYTGTHANRNIENHTQRHKLTQAAA